MVGIREAAMGSEEEPTPSWPSHTQPYKPITRSGSLFEDNDGYDYNYDEGVRQPVLPYTPLKTNYTPAGYTKEDYEKITILITIESKSMGKIGDWHDHNYDEKKAETKAIEIAYDRVEELLGKNYESKFVVAFSAYEGTNEFEITVTLTPIKK